MDDIDVPEEFICAISHDIMDDPVIANDGQSYNRPDILQWLQHRQISPLTNQPLTASGLVTNFALRAAIQRWNADHAGRRAAPRGAPVKKRAVPTFKLTGSADARVKTLSCDATQPMETMEILVLDNSGSMASSAARTASAEGGDYTRLDLVKHASRTVAAMLAERTTQGISSYLSIITYSNDAKVIMPLRKMTSNELDSTFDKISAIQVEGSTNIWDGLRLALDTAVRAAHMHPDAAISIRLLTDGEPTASLNPATGIVGALTRKLATMPHVNLNISAFGFGFSLDDQLLREISQTGSGVFGYIPDCSMVATVFINAVANSLASVARNVRIHWEDGSETRIPNIIEAHPVSIVTKQTKGVLSCDNSADTQAITVTEQKGGVDVMFELACGEVQAELAKYLDGHQTAGALTHSLMTMVEALTGGGAVSPAVADLVQDIYHKDDHKGQLTKALSRADWLREWGRNHLIAYMRALQTQQCVNFKDAAPQHFLSDKVRELREMGNQLFNNLPAPKPTLAAQYGYGAGGAAGGGGAPVAMDFFNNARGGCWAGHCLVRMGDDTYLRASEINAGDYVWGGHRVLCVVRTEYKEPIQMCHLGDLSLTPWHPVRNVADKECRWYFPAELVSKGVGGSATQEMIHYTYNLVLESGHTVEIGTYKVCTLGHYMEGPVIAHDYFGTRRVVDDLKCQPGWSNGFVSITPDQWMRGDDGRVSRLCNGGGAPNLG